MSNIANLYTDELKKHFKVLYANWIPGSPLELGDYGILDRNIFIPLGKLKSDFPEFNGNVIQVIADDTKDQAEFKSEGGVEVNLLAKGSLNTAGIPLIKAALEIKFTSENCIFFNAAECTTTRIANKNKIGEILKKLHKDGKWQKKFCVVTDLVQAGKTIIAVSKGNNSGISFEADSPAIEKINLADASIKLNLTSERSIGYKVDAQDGLYILLGLSKIKNVFPWWKDNFSPEKLLMTEAIQYRIENSPEIKTEETAEELAFGQMGMALPNKIIFTL